MHVYEKLTLRGGIFSSNDLLALLVSFLEISTIWTSDIDV